MTMTIEMVRAGLMVGNEGVGETTTIEMVQSETTRAWKAVGEVRGPLEVRPLGNSPLHTVKGM
jgi:hypothetical protein